MISIKNQCALILQILKNCEMFVEMWRCFIYYCLSKKLNVHGRWGDLLLIIVSNVQKYVSWIFITTGLPKKKGTVGKPMTDLANLGV